MVLQLRNITQKVYSSMTVSMAWVWMCGMWQPHIEANWTMLECFIFIWRQSANSTHTLQTDLSTVF